MEVLSLCLFQIIHETIVPLLLQIEEILMVYIFRMQFKNGKVLIRLKACFKKYTFKFEVIINLKSSKIKN